MKTFIFSTFGAPVELLGRDQEQYNEVIAKNHLSLREILEAKGYRILGEFACGGFNTNRFLKYFGGVNKGRPNAEDLLSAEKFAENLKIE